MDNAPREVPPVRTFEAVDSVEGAPVEGEPVDSRKKKPYEDARLRSWGLVRKFAFRFAFVYFLLYAAESLVGVIPSSDPVTEFYSELKQDVVQWTADTVLSVPITTGMSGSGDRMSNYVELLVFATVALVLAGLWSLVMYRKKHHAVLAWLLATLSRYYLAIVMFGYGFAKILPGQFQPPSFSRLLGTYGDSSPMGILWTFMGTSVPFTIFAGCGEVLGGFLLLFKRTATLGAFIVIAVMGSVVMMNFSYDVPVKLFSSHLLFMAIVLLMFDIRRVTRFFILNRPTEPRRLMIPFRTAALRWIVFGLEIVAVGWLLFATGKGAYEANKMYATFAEKPELYGLYEVTKFVRDKEVPPLVTDDSRWSHFIVDRGGRTIVRVMGGPTIQYRLEADVEARTIELSSFGGSGNPMKFTYERTPESMVLTGDIEGQSVTIETTIRDREEFLLVNRGFHWISEFPYNR